MFSSESASNYCSDGFYRNMAWPDSAARTKHHIFGGGRLISILRYYRLTVLFQGNELFSPSVSWG